MILLNIGSLPELSTSRLTGLILTFFDGVIAWAFSERQSENTISHFPCRLTQKIVDKKELLYESNQSTTAYSLMTPKQTQRLVKKIADIKRVLATEKRKFGGYDDSRGLRYLPTRYYLQLGDYAGGLAYTRWFAKSFPSDVGFPDFLFEWSVLLFKAGKLAQARDKVWQTYCANTYVLAKFFGQPVQPINKYEWSAMAQPGFADYFTYSNQQADLVDFSQWLGELMSTDVFQHQQARFLAIHQRLATALTPDVRRCLLEEVRQLETEFSPSIR